jgi:hypothetical protein
VEAGAARISSKKASVHGLRDKGAGEEQGTDGRQELRRRWGVEVRGSGERTWSEESRESTGGRIERHRFGNFLCGEGETKAPKFVTRLSLSPTTAAIFGTTIASHEQLMHCDT